MMNQDTLRKADLFSGTLIMLLGLFVVSQATEMPMKDSWGGVQNVWFVSPALFPLFVGSILGLLGFILICIAFKSTGKEGLKEISSFLFSQRLTTYLLEKLNLRFYAIVFNLFSFVFIMVPHIDFFPGAIFFLLVLFFMFYLEETRQLLRIFGYVIVTNLILGVLLFTTPGQLLSNLSEFYGDWFVIIAMIVLCLFVRFNLLNEQESRRKFRLSLTIAIIAPTLIGIVFKYFLLVPMPFEGLIVQLLDSIWYADLWS